MVTRNDFSIISPLFETSIKVRGFVNKKYLVKTFFHPANIFPLANNCRYGYFSFVKNCFNNCYLLLVSKKKVIDK